MTKKTIIISILLVLVGVGSAYFLFWSGEETSKFETARAEKRSLTQTVEETGKVRGREEIDLSFDQAGTLETNLVEKGDEVKKGDRLAELDHDTLDIQKKEAQAGLEAARIRLIKLRSGGAPSDVNVSRSQFEQAEENYQSALSSLEETEKSVNNNIKQAEEHLYDLKDGGPGTVTSYEQAVNSARQNLADTKETYGEQVANNKESVVSTCDNSISVANTALDKVDGIINDDDLRDIGVLSAKNSSYLTQAERYYRESLELLDEAKAALSKTRENNSRENLDELLESTLELLDKTFATLDNCYKVLENSITSSEFPASELNSFKATINEQTVGVNSSINSTQSVKHSLNSAYTSYNTKMAAAKNALDEAKTKLDDAIRSAEDSLETAQVNGEQQITSAENQVETARSSLEVARAQFDKTESPGRDEDISLAQAEIEQARASLELVEKKIDNSIITAPRDGEITGVNFDPGEQVSPQSPAIRMIAGEGLKIEVNISEVDITKIERGDEVTITLDAFSEDEEFYGRVEDIDPAETVIQDVVYYEVAVDFTDENSDLSGIKPGMTANITVHTEQKNDVLVVPSRAIIEKGDGQKIVRVPTGAGQMEEKEVETGLRGDGGLTEVTKGLEEGEEVITYIEE